MVKRLGIVLAVVALSGCGDVLKDLIPHASCNNTTLGTCGDLSGAVGSALTDFQSACTTAGGINGSAECPAANRIGSCTYAPFPGVGASIRYYSSKWTLIPATAACNALATPSVSVTFTPG
jgi:hypothetical protein